MYIAFRLNQYTPQILEQPSTPDIFEWTTFLSRDLRKDKSGTIWDVHSKARPYLLNLLMHHHSGNARWDHPYLQSHRYKATDRTLI